MGYRCAHCLRDLVVDAFGVPQPCPDHPAGQIQTDPEPPPDDPPAG